MVLDVAGRQFADRSKVFPGAVVVIRGLRQRGAVAGLVLRVHPDDIMMTDVDGDEITWTGQMPILDVLIVDPDIVDETGVLQQPKQRLSRTNGTPVHLAKVPWAADIERRASWKGLPHFITSQAVRYVIVGELSGV
jgi:hypothetical protein